MKLVLDSDHCTDEDGHIKADVIADAVIAFINAMDEQISANGGSGMWWEDWAGMSRKFGDQILVSGDFMAEQMRELDKMLQED